MKSNTRIVFWQIFKLSISDQILLPYKFILVHRLFYENRVWIVTIEEMETRILYKMENKKISIHLLFLSFSIERNFPDSLFENTTIIYIYIYKILHFRSEFVVPETYSPVFIDLTRKTKCKVRIFLMRVRLIEE